jgi:hypothetical protein
VAALSCALAVWLRTERFPDAPWWNLMMVTALVTVLMVYLWRERRRDS